MDILGDTNNRYPPVWQIKSDKRVSEKGALIFFVKVRTFASSDFFISSKMFILEHVNR